MIYLGSKRRIAKHIIPIMVEEANKRGITTWVEPFVGGANLIDKVPDNFTRVGYDFFEHTIYALKDIRDNLESLPKGVSEEYYKSLLGTPPSPITSWVRFVCSFGSKFEGGYARNSRGDNYAKAGYNNAKKQHPLLQGIEFEYSDYKDLNIKDSLIYCDPPYQKTTGYKTGDFNHEEFFEWCREQKDKGNIVFVSEYEAPEDFKVVWSGEVLTDVSNNSKDKGFKAVEKLFLV